MTESNSYDSLSELRIFRRGYEVGGLPGQVMSLLRATGGPVEEWLGGAFRPLSGRMPRPGREKRSSRPGGRLRGRSAEIAFSRHIK
jgi:hypothetical protein